MAENWAEDVKKYVKDADADMIAAIVRYCGIALRNRDSSLVSFSDKTELARVRDNFLKKKLGLTDPDDKLDAAINAVGAQMKGDRSKNRVTVYYLLLDQLGAHGRLAKAKPKAAPKAVAEKPAKAAAAKPVKAAKVVAEKPAKVAKVVAEKPAKVAKVVAEKPAKAAKAAAEKPAKAAKAAAEKPAKPAKTAAAGVGAGALGLASLTGTAKAATGAAKKAMVSLEDKPQAAAKAATAAVKKTAAAAKETAGAAVKTAASATKKTASAAKGAASATVKTAATTAKKSASAAKDTAGAALGLAGAAVAGTAAVASDAAGKVAAAGGSVVGAAGDAASAVVDKVADLGSAATEKAGAAVSGAAAALTGGVSSGVQSLTHKSDDDDSAGLGWLWWVLLALLAAFLIWWVFLRGDPAATEGAVSTATAGATASAAASAGAVDLAAAPAEGSVAINIPAGAGYTVETRAGKPVVKVYFDTGKTDVVPDFGQAGEALKAWLGVNAGSSIAVSGYNDASGNAAANAELSKNRAQAVKAALVAAGIADASVELVKPADTTDASVAAEAARRVEVVVR